MWASGCQLRGTGRRSAGFLVPRVRSFRLGRTLGRPVGCGDGTSVPRRAARRSNRETGAPRSISRSGRRGRESESSQGWRSPGTVPSHEKPTQRRTEQNLPGAAAPIVNLAPVADGVGMGPDHDLQAVAPALRIHVDIDDDTEERLDLVENLREELARTAHADNHATSFRPIPRTPPWALANPRIPCVIETVDHLRSSTPTAIPIRDFTPLTDIPRRSAIKN